MLPVSNRPRRLVLLGIIASLAVLLGSAAFVQERNDAIQRGMDARVRELQAAWNARSFARPVAWGEVAPGNAFDHYDLATSRAAELLRADNDALVATLRRSDAEVAEQTGELRARWQPVVDALRAGAHAERAMPPLQPIDGAPTGVNGLLSCRWVANAAVFAARAARHEGRGVEAVQHTLDAAAFGADIARHGTLIQQMIGVAMLTIGSGEAWPEPALARLDQDALSLLADGLERIDRSLPPWLDQDAELLFLARALRSQPASGDGATRAPWRFLFSEQWMVADAFDRVADLAAELARTRQLPWPQRQALIEQECATIANGDNPLAANCVPNLANAESCLREGIASLRLLRMAVDRHLGRDLPPVRDPLGDGPIRVRVTDEGVRLWCAGDDQRPNRARLVAR